MSCIVRLHVAVLFVFSVHICRGRYRNELPLSRLSDLQDTCNTENNADTSHRRRPPPCYISTLEDLRRQYCIEYPLLSIPGSDVVFTAYPSLVLSAISRAACDKMMIVVEDQRRPRLELNGHDITDRLLLLNDSTSCYRAILNSNEYDLRLQNSTCYASLRIVTGFPIVTISVLSYI